MNLTTSNIMAIRRFDQKIQLLSRQKKGIKRGLVQLQLVEMIQRLEARRCAKIHPGQRTSEEKCP